MIKENFKEKNSYQHFNKTALYLHIDHGIIMELISEHFSGEVLVTERSIRPAPEVRITVSLTRLTGQTVKNADLANA